MHTKSFSSERRARIKEQSKQVATYLDTVEPASYEVGEITLKLTEEEVGFLNECLDTIQEHHPSLQLGHYDSPVDVFLFESVEKKITDLYDDECLKYELSPALKKFYELYGTYGTENDVEKAKWEVFRDAFHAGFEFSKGAQ